MTRPSRTTKSQGRLSPEERGRGFAKLAAEISQGILPGDYSEAAISAFGVEMGNLFAKWEAEDALRKLEQAKAEPKPAKPRSPSISKLIEQAEKAGKPLASITLPNGTKLDFSRAEHAEPENPWLADLRKETKQ